MCVLACRLELKDKSIRKVFTCFVCVDVVTGGGALERVQISILAKGLKIECFGIIS